MTTNSFLDTLSISQDAISGPYFGIIYGAAGVGKTWLCKHAEKPFFIATEKGCEKVVGIGKFTIKDEEGNESVYLPKNTEEFFEMLRKFTRKGHDYKTIVIDSGMFVDKLFVNDIIAANPVETTNAGTKQITSLSDYKFGTGFEKVLAIWENRFFAAISALHKRGINVILIAHSKEKTTRDLDGDEYKKNMIDLLQWGQYSVPNLLSAKADFVLFMRSEVHTTKKFNSFGPMKKVADNDIPPEIMVYTRASSAFNAKIRTTNINNVKDCYKIDITDDSTSQKLFEDLKL